ncbi:hypothetical protein APSETT444_003950 [Aspergillus pseudonomiae]
MPRARRSTRFTGGRTKYTNDPFEAAGVSDESDGGSKARKGGKEPVSDESSDEEFQANEEQEEEEEDEDEGSEEEVAGENDDDEEEAEEEDAASDGGRGAQKAVVARPKLQRKRLGNDLAMLSKDELHSRGTHSSMEHMGKMLHMTITFGTDEKDLLSIVYARQRWSMGLDSGFPTRASLNEAPDVPDCGFGPTFGVEPEEVERERTQGWDWYYDDDVGGRFRKRQRLESISEKEAFRKFIPQAREKKHTVLIGPVNDQKVFTLGQHESFNFGDAFGEVKAREKAKPATGGKSKSKASAQEDSTGRTRKKREGWIINLGQKVQCMAWAPNQPGLTQYLAVSTPISKEEKEAYPDPFKDRGARAFRPSPPYPCALQLWMFKAEREESLTKHIDMNFEPKLRLALCTNWGDLRRMAWCPMSRDPREEDDDDALQSVGLLAGIWGDGYLRVLDIKLSGDPNQAEYSTTSMDGETRLWSVLDPQKDMVDSNRMRVGSPYLTYSPLLHSFLSSDENDFARLLAVRRFYTTTAVARFPSTVSSLSPCSVWHPSVMYGCTSGAVVATNPLRRLLHVKEKQWQQTWFTHEWARGDDASGSGISRFHDGYRAESISLLRNMMGDRKMVNGVMTITIYEEGTHVTALSWNPNQACAGWASAGMGCGLIRVEDLAT